jgi:hypothetical protein
MPYTLTAIQRVRIGGVVGSLAATDMNTVALTLRLMDKLALKDGEIQACGLTAQGNFTNPDAPSLLDLNDDEVTFLKRAVLAYHGLMT